MPERKPTLFSSILLTGLIAGTLDITGATIHFMLRGNSNPVRILEYIASGVFGKEAFSGNPMMAVAGLLFHYIIATSWTTLFYLAYPRVGFLRGNKFVVGAVYALFVWLMMNRVVIPLSSVSQGPFNPAQAA